MTAQPLDGDYPQLRSAITTYIVKDREDFLVIEYQKRGEEDLEFAGLGDELQQAAKHPATARAMFKETLGFEGEDAEIRQACIDLYNRLKGVGVFDKTKQEKVEGAELFQQTGGRPVVIAGKPLTVKGHPITLGMALGFFLGFGLIGWALNTYVSWPSWLAWFPTIFQGVAFFGVLFTSSALVMLRSEVRDPGKAARREKAREEAKGKREAKMSRRDKWWSKMTF